MSFVFFRENYVDVLLNFFTTDKLTDVAKLIYDKALFATKPSHFKILVGHA